MRVFSFFSAAALLAFVTTGCTADNSAVDDAGADMLSSVEPSADGAIADSAAATDGASAPDAASCPPGLPATVPCGKCGTAAQTCVDGKATTGACMGEHGICAPTDTVTTPDGCMIRDCGPDCSAWGPWRFKPPAKCSTGQTNTCDLPGCGFSDKGTMKCLAGCKWGPCTCS